MNIIRCDNCPHEVTLNNIDSPYKPGWISVTPVPPLARPARFAEEPDAFPPYPPPPEQLVFCSWACVAAYGSARSLVESAEKP